MIVVLGSCSIDLFTYARRLPELGETVMGSSFLKAFGGKGANQAVQAGRLAGGRGRVAFAGRVGTSEEGRSIVANLREAGLDTECVGTGDEVAAGVALIEVEERTGRNRIVVVPGANARVRASDAASLWPRASLAVLQLEVPIPVTLEALRAAREARVLTVLNPSPVPSSPEDLASVVAALPLVSILVVNEIEAAQLLADSGARPPSVTLETAVACGERLLERGAQCVVITLGQDGAVLVDGPTGARVRVPSPNVAVVDTTGAGDSFLGALTVFLSEDGGRDAWTVESLRNAARRACIVASVSVQKPGCQPSYPTRAEVEHLLLQQQQQ